MRTATPITTILIPLLLALAIGLGAARAAEPVLTTSPFAAPSAVRYFQAGETVVGFSPSAISLSAPHAALDVAFLDPAGSIPLPGPTAAPDGEHPAVPLTSVTYPNLWSGVDVVYEAVPDGGLKSTYTLAPGANPAQIRLRYSQPVEILPDGALRAASGLRESVPLAWQEIEGRRVPVSAGYVIEIAPEGQTVTFQLGAYDPAYPLVLDPTMRWEE